jgi:hypothetical protein
LANQLVPEVWTAQYVIEDAHQASLSRKRHPKAKGSE